MGQGNRHMSSKRLYELEKRISAHQDKHGHGSIHGQWGSRRFRAHPWCAESPQGFLSSTHAPLLSSGEGAYAAQEEGQLFDWTLLGLWSPGIRGSERGRSSGSGTLWCSSWNDHKGSLLLSWNSYWVLCSTFIFLSPAIWQLFGFGCWLPAIFPVKALLRENPTL